MLKRFSLLLLLVLLGLVCWWPPLTRAATMPGAKGDAVLYSETDTIDVPVLKMNGVTVGTVAPVIFSVRTNQTLAAATVIQHGSFNDRIEIVQISSTGGALTSTASPRILAGVQGQIIVLQGTSSTNTYTIPDGYGIRLTTSGSATFSDRSMMILRYDTTGSVWRETTTLTGAPTALKDPVRVATTANITLSGTQTIDGVALTVTTPRTRVLVKNQTTAAENGPYTVETGAWIRAVDFDESAEARTNAEFVVEEGTTQAGSTCRMITTGAITLGSTALTFRCNSAAFVDLTEQASDLPTPPAGIWRIYPKSTGIHARDPSGTIVGPFGAGGGGGGVGITTVRVATTGNITLSGEQTIDGFSTSGSTVLVKDQTTATANGIYVSSSGAWTRSTSFDTSAEFVAGFPVYVQGGTANGGTVWNFSVIGSFTLGSTNATFAKTALGPTGELIANRSTVATSVANGYIGADSNGRVAYNRLGSGASHTALAAANTITPTALEMGIEGSGGAVNLTSNPQVAAGIDGQLLFLYGTHATNTVQIDNGTGVRLCGNAGSVIVGLNLDDLILRYNTTAAAWVQQGCQRKIYGATDLASAFSVCDTPNGNCTNFFASTTQGTNSGGVIDQIVNIPAAKNSILQGNGTEFERMTVAGVHTYSNSGKPLSMVALPAGNLGGSANCTFMQDEAWIASGELQSAWRCTDNDGDFLSFSLPMPRAWDRGALIFQHQVHSLTNQNTTVVGEDVALRCVRQGDADAAYSATGAQTLTATFGNQANDNRYPITALVTPNGTCTGEAAGTTVVIKGRIRMRATPTTATMTNVRLASLTIFYRAASRSND